MTGTCEILTQLTIDPYLCHAYTVEPERTLANLGASARDLLANGADSAPEDWTICACCSDPGFDPMPGDTDAEQVSTAIRAE